MSPGVTQNVGGLEISMRHLKSVVKVDQCLQHLLEDEHNFMKGEGLDLALLFQISSQSEAHDQIRSVSQPKVDKLDNVILICKLAGIYNNGRSTYMRSLRKFSKYICLQCPCSLGFESLHCHRPSVGH